MLFPRYLAALAATVALHVLGASLLPSLGRYLDLFVALWLTFALRSAPLPAMGFGLLTGWAEDAVSGAPYGLHGAVASLLGFLTGWFGRHLVLQHRVVVAATYAGAAAVQGTLVYALDKAFGRATTLAWPGLLSQCLGAAICGVLIHLVADRWRSRREHRRAGRPRRVRL